ncbi:hypothetical protein BGW42_007159 [Actinomortierella wolfii]|nr:hypothetical protein BGW42_007159 [Actinomortierella wolfii]
MPGKRDHPRPPRIGSPMTELKMHYDAIVVGSGYGGAIAASRLARAGKRVCLLERGEERWPGEYPEGTIAATAEVQFNTEHGQEGKKTGLFEIHKNDDQWAFVACGLGGTSLLNANTALKPDPRIWENKVWPEELSQDKALLEESFQLANDMLQPVPYPEDWPELPKLTTLEKQAKGAGVHEKFTRPPITVHFKDAMNPAGVMQKKSTLTGNDTTGINDWSKNTTLMNYIPDAWNHGAEIYTCCNVVRIEHSTKRSAPYTVYFEWVEEGRDEFLKEHGAIIPPMFVTADIVVLGAGALGSTEILLRSVKTGGLTTSDQLGKHFSGNGDFLAFSYNGETLVNGVSMGDEKPSDFKHPVGPVITGLIDYRDTPNVMDGYVVEEGAIPCQAALLLRSVYGIMDDTTSKDLVSAQDASIQEKIQRNARELTSYITGVHSGAMSHTQTFLVMSHDDAQGELSLKSDRIRITWPGIGSTRNFSRLDKLLEPLAMAVRGTYIRNPLSAATDNAIVTVHPIGGCSIGRSGADGVINHKCQVFTGQGDEVYEGLYVMDGAVIPMSIGVNPFLTISALAERACILLARDRGWSIKYDPTTTPLDFKNRQFPIPYDHTQTHPNAAKLAELLKKSSIQDVKDMEGEVLGLIVSEPVPGKSHDGDSSDSSDSDSDDEELRKGLPKLFNDWGKSKKQDPKRTGVMFTELLRGHLSTVVLSDDYETADNQARSSGSTMNLTLTLSTGPIKEYLKRTIHTCQVVGTVSCRAMSDQPMMIESGVFTVYKPAEDDPSSKDELVYKLGLLCASGERYRFEGRKPLKTANVLEGWINPSEVLVTVYKVDSETLEETIYGRGKLGKDDDDFFTEIKSLRGDSLSFGSNLQAIKEFSVNTIGATVRQYLPFLNKIEYPEDMQGRKSYPRQRPEPQTFDVIASDGFKTLLTRYKGKKGPVLLLHGASVSTRIFTTDLIPHNLCDFLLAQGYDVWLLDWRMSILLEDSHKQSHIYGGARDHAAAIKIILAETGCESVQVVAHCVGSLTLFAGLLNGEIEGVSSIVGSQVATRPKISTFNRVKQNLHLVPLFEKVLKQEEFDCNTERKDSTLLDRTIDNALRFIPLPADEQCNNAVCRRASFCYGLLWEHEKISKNVHDHLDEILGAINMTSMAGLVDNWCKKKTLTNADDVDVVTPENMKRVFENMPVLLFHGSENQVFIPDSTMTTIEELRETNMPLTGMAYDYQGLYQRKLIKGYGHLDGIIGDRAYKDVYPIILQHLEANLKYTNIA